MSPRRCLVPLQSPASVPRARFVRPPGTRPTERGASLLVSLVFLAVLSLFAAVAMTGTTLEERMARNSRDGELAMEAAETAMRDAERDLAPVGGGASRISTNIGFVCGCGTATANRGLCVPADVPICAAGAVNPAPIWTTGVLDAGDAHNVPIGTYTGDPGIALNKAGGGVTTVGGLAAPPRYVIEVIDEGGAGSGSTQNAQGSPLCSKKMPSCGSYHYRITASGTGPVASTRMDVQEIYRP